MNAPTAGARDHDDELDARARAERALVTCFIAIRTVHLAQGAICTFRGSRSYRRPKVAVATFAVSVVESGWLFTRLLHDRSGAPGALKTDVGFGAVGLVALGAATERHDRTTSLNWMLPYTVGAASATAVGMPRRSSRMGVAAALAAVYAATVFEDIQTGGAPAATALANAVSYLGFTAVVDVVVSVLRRHANELEATKQRAVAQAIELGEARERDHQHRFLHDSVLQTLEALQKRWDPDDAAMRARVHQDATRLRGVLQGREPGDADLRAALNDVASESAALGLRVEIVMPDAESPRRDVVAVLRDATREALTNVAKHAGTSEVVVHVDTDDDGIRLTVRDHGRGFDPASTPPGFGQRQSILGRVGDIGGSVTIWSEPGRGTRIQLWVPR